MGQLSPDGHWRWDGWRWVPAQPVIGQLSPDGQWRWGGSQWVPARPAGVSQVRAPRVPTIWTRRLQVMLLVVAGLQFLVGLTSAVGSLVDWRAFQAVIVAQWHAEGIPPGEVSTLERSIYTVFLVSIIFVLLLEAGFCALQMVGTLRRWVWWFWVQFGIFCLGAFALLLTPLDLTSPMFRVEAFTLPFSIGFGLVEVGAGVCMLIAAVRIGPWAMTRHPERLGARQGRP